MHSRTDFPNFDGIGTFMLSRNRRPQYGRKWTEADDRAALELCDWFDEQVAKREQEAEDEQG